MGRAVKNIKYVKHFLALIVFGSLLFGCGANAKNLEKESISMNGETTGSVVAKGSDASNGLKDGKGLVDTNGSVESRVADDSSETDGVNVSADTIETEREKVTDNSNDVNNSKITGDSIGLTNSSDDFAITFTRRDLEQNPDLFNARRISLSDYQDINITAEGMYVLSGETKEVTIRVDVTKNEKVQLVLDNVSITNESTPAIHILKADKVFVTTTMNSTNKLYVNSEFNKDENQKADAVIFSKDDIVLNGLGEIEIVSSKNGITSKDDLKVTGGTYRITSQGDALEANDLVAIANGDFTIHSSKDGIHAENSENNGAIQLFGGLFHIEATDDGIQGTTRVRIDGGDYKIVAGEGIEGTEIVVNAGNIDIEAMDDGMNTTDKVASLYPSMIINGGNITIKMGEGDTDALDSNGDLTITGGNISIQGRSAFDYDYKGTYTGGILIVNGEVVKELKSSTTKGDARPR